MLTRPFSGLKGMSWFSTVRNRGSGRYPPTPELRHDVATQHSAGLHSRHVLDSDGEENVGYVKGRVIQGRISSSAAAGVARVHNQ